MRAYNHKPVGKTRFSSALTEKGIDGRRRSNGKNYVTGLKLLYNEEEIEENNLSV